MKTQACAVLMDLVMEFKMMFHKLFIMEVNLFYKETLNKVGGELPSDARKVQCWALVTKLLCTVFKATHGAQSFATEAGGAAMYPLQTNGYFCTLLWRSLVFSRHKEFGHNMLGLSSRTAS